MTVPSRLERLAPLTGVLATGLIFAEFAVTGETADIHDSTSAVVTYWRENETAMELASAFVGLAAVALIWFGASLRHASATRGGADGARLGSLAHAGTIVIGIWLTILSVLSLGAAHSVGEVPAEVTHALTLSSSEDVFVPLALGSTLLLLSTGISVLRHRWLPTWLGWLSVVLGVLGLLFLPLGAVVSTGFGFISFLLSLLWMPVVAIALYRRPPVEQVAAAG